MSINLKFTVEDWERIERDWTVWWAGELNRPMIMMETFNPLIFGSRKIYTREWMLELPVNEVLDIFQEQMEKAYYYGDAWPKFFYNHGPGIAAGFLGANVHSMPDQHTIWFDAPQQVPIEKLHLAYDADNIWWQRVLSLTRGAVERWGDKVAVAHTDIGGNLDILASFRTTNQLLYDLYDAPDEVMRLSKEITTAWIRYYNELNAIIEKGGRGTCNWAAVWSPKRTCMHQSDFCYMISPEMFESFVLPDLNACFEIMDHAFYHLDGKGQIPHLDMLLAMENLAGIQWIPGAGQPEVEKWLDLLKRIIDGGKRCQVYVTAEGARKIVQELGGKGFALYVINRMKPDEAEDFLKTLAAEDISRPNRS
ncbi:MAG: hypothetical protein JRI95_01910 [Deltaproteobacteria bacterium]|nr:hypothetical protein [Deltaproteobacteria bacterium]MBW2086561.1 hypothetical protein [Deltaproteobacteria bacterium]